MTELSGKIDNGKYAEIEITDFEGRSCNINGYISFKLKNQSKNTVNAYAKVDLYSKQNLLAATEYIEILDFKPQEEKRREVHRLYVPTGYPGEECRVYRILFTLNSCS